MNNNEHIFISYSSKDIIYVNQVLRALQDVGIVYWKAPDRIPAGSNYAKEIPKAISTCSLFLLILSENSQESIWVEKELDTAICCKKKILPVRIDACELNDMFKFYLNNVQILQSAMEDGKIKDIDNIIKNVNIVGNNQPAKKVVVYEEKIEKKTTDQRSNALRMNKIPLECEKCGGTVTMVSIGIYRCDKCGNDNYDDFYKVRNYIEKHGPAPALIISRNTGVSMATIEHFKVNGYLSDVSQIIGSLKW